MALVSVTDAARLVHKGRTTLYRDIEKGRLRMVVLPEGETAVETNDLVRAYGQDTVDEGGADPQNAFPTLQVQVEAAALPTKAYEVPRQRETDSTYKARIAVLEERVHSLERVIGLEAEVRRIKDQVTTELRARLSDKDALIRALQGKMAASAPLPRMDDHLESVLVAPSVDEPVRALTTASTTAPSTDLAKEAAAPVSISDAEPVRQQLLPESDGVAAHPVPQVQGSVESKGLPFQKKKAPKTSWWSRLLKPRRA